MKRIFNLRFWAFGGWFTFAAVGAYFGISAGAAAAATAGIVGTGVSLYGANKQSQAVGDAANANAASQDKTNASAWSAYLMTRGVSPNGATTGQIPANPQAINARLPLWANANFSNGPRGWRKKGAGGPAANTLTMAPAPYIAPQLGGDQ